LLAALGAPKSASNLQALNYWAQSEGNVINNPLATSGQGAGATTCVAQCGSSSPIYEYATEAQGVAQMARFMGGSNSAGIVHALQQDAGLAGVYQAINGSKWCAGCQNGHYPVQLYQAVLGSGGSVSSGVGSGAGGSPGGGTGGAATPGPKSCALGITVPSAGNAIVSVLTLGLVNTGGQNTICFVTGGQWKALKSAFFIAAGIGIGGFGVIVLAAWGFQATGAKRAVGKVAGSLPGPAGRIVRGTGAAGGGAPTQQQRSAARVSESSRRAASSRAYAQRLGVEGERRETRVRVEQERGTQRRATAAQRPLTVPGARRHRRPLPKPGSPESRARAEQPF
jgi:hypothetical protein